MREFRLSNVLAASIARGHSRPTRARSGTRGGREGGKGGEGSIPAEYLSINRKKAD